MKTYLSEQPVVAEITGSQAVATKWGWHRLAYLSASAAAAACAVLLPIQSRIWNGSTGPPPAVLFTELVVPHLPDSPAATLAQPPLHYFAFGHLFLLIYVGLLVTTALLPTTASRLKTGLLLTLGVGAAANVGVYWWGEYLVKAVREGIFWNIEVPALAATLLLVTALAYQAQRHQPRRFGKVLPFLVLPMALAFTLTFQYLPHGPMLAVALTLLALLAGRGEAPARTLLTRGQRAVVIGTGILLVLQLVLSGAMQYRPQLRTGPVVRDLKPLPYRTHTGLRLHVFNTGYNRMSRALVPGEPVWRPAPAFVIDHPRAGLVVFDAGLSAAVASRGEAALPFPMSAFFESRGAPAETLAQQMRRAGLEPNRVRLVVLSHLHADHPGDLSAFPNAWVLHTDFTHLFLVNSSFNPRSINMPPVTLFNDFSMI